jgi:hypothetical protein
MLKHKFQKLIIIFLIAVTPVSVFAQSILPGFNPNQLISDANFGDTQTFGGAGGIQKFLVSKGSVLASADPAFLQKLKEPTITTLKQALEDPEPNLPRLRTAAELIWDAAKQSNINPQVLLVTLNKEQGLITSKTDINDPTLQKALDHALGFACPDSGGCGNLFPGFYYQLFGNLDSSSNRYLGAAKSLSKSFTASGGRGPSINGSVSHVGDTITLDNTLGGYDGLTPQQAVTLLNNATAALYRYTPHVFNGNYNFWKFFTAWFKYANGTLLKLSSSSSVFIIQNGLKQPVPQFVAIARALNLNNATVVSQTELDGYQTDKVYGPVDNTVVKGSDGKQYVFIESVPHPVSISVIKQRGLDPDLTYNITSDELGLFTIGSILPPKDGTIIRGTTNKSVYLVVGGKIKMYSGYTFAQNKITPKQITNVSDSEIVTYTIDGFVAPQDGSIVKSPNDNTVYLVQSGVKQPILADIFKNRGLTLKQVATISSEEIAGLSTGSFATPKDYTFFAQDSKTGPMFEFKEGTTHTISAYVAKQRGIKPDYVFSSSVISNWSEGIPVPPRDGAIVKGDADGTVFLVSKGQLRPMSGSYFTKHKIGPKKVIILPQAEVDAYAKGDALQ